MNYHKIEPCSMLNGESLRTVLWISGCTLKCPKCFNPQTWDFDSGKDFNYEALTELFEAVSKPYIKGLTLTGGNPLDLRNLYSVSQLVKNFHDHFKDTKDLWIYTGYTWEEICQMTQVEYYTSIIGKELMLYGILNRTNVVVDGRYVDELNDVKFPYRGSTNQRLIDVAASRSSTEQYYKVEDMVEYEV